MNERPCGVATHVLISRRGFVRGKYAARRAESSNIVRIAGKEDRSPWQEAQQIAMPIFSRRRIQSMLDEMRPLLTAKANALIGRLLDRKQIVASGSAKYFDLKNPASRARLAQSMTALEDREPLFPKMRRTCAEPRAS